MTEGTSPMKLQLYEPPMKRMVRRPIIFYPYHHKFLLAFYKAKGNGLTNEELTFQSCSGKTNAVRSCWELRWMGYVEDSGFCRRTMANHGATVWCIAPKGREKVKRLLASSLYVKKKKSIKKVIARKSKIRNKKKGKLK